jgi:hypothetical protein
MSGGLPHSDIHGSKPVPGSPWLNAGYHVLHRLLLPRHPPNALFALDLIQKEQGQGLPPNPIFLSVKSCILTHVAIRWFAKTTTVSVLDLEQYRPGRSAMRMQHTTDPMPPYSGAPDDTDVSLSIRCQSVLPRGSTVIPHRMIKHANPARLMIMCGSPKRHACPKDHGGSRRT